jgi:hypothetical protein
MSLNWIIEDKNDGTDLEFAVVKFMFRRWNAGDIETINT